MHKFEGTSIFVYLCLGLVVKTHCLMYSVKLGKGCVKNPQLAPNPTLTLGTLRRELDAESWEFTRLSVWKVIRHILLFF